MEQGMQEMMDRVSVDGAPDRDTTQEELTRLFVGALLLRGGLTPDEVCIQFAQKHAGVLRWLGTERQDAILRAGEHEANVDLARWLKRGGKR